MSRLAKYVPKGAKVPAAAYTHRQIIRSEWAACRRLLDELISVLHAFEFIEEDIFGIATSVWEALENAVTHGNNCVAHREVTVEASIAPEMVRIRITDAGKGFNPQVIPDPSLTENLHRLNGRGLLMMRHLMTGLRFSDSGRTVEMWKERKRHG
jgi:serine/threonine-protein kinase RsbW